MRIEGRRYRDEWLPNCYPAREVGNNFVRLSRIGTTQVLSREANEQLDQLSMTDALFDRLERTGHIITPANAHTVFSALKMWQRNNYAGPALHIVALTKRCNLNCTYCHMLPVAVSESRTQFDMSEETARAACRFALATPNPNITFEFQGGEPFLNFPTMKFFVEEAIRQNVPVGKKIKFAVTSNLMLVTEEHMEFCREYDISVSYSLNGPQEVHDAFRMTRSGAGSFDKVMVKIRRYLDRYGAIMSASPLCVVGADLAPRLRGLIDWYHEQGFRDVAIIRLKPLGTARVTRLGFSAEQFNECYLDALDYIYDKNANIEGPAYSERMLRVALVKILSNTGVGFVDWRNPNGDFSGAITYDYDGTVLPSDEARSQRDRFALGNVHTDTYDGIVARGAALETMTLSLRDRDSVCRECSWNPYCGVLPVLDYATRGDATPIPHESAECLFTIALLDWTFTKLMQDPLPLMRMAPALAKHLTSTVQEQRSHAAAAALAS